MKSRMVEYYLLKINRVFPTKLSATDLCSVLPLLCLGVSVRGGEGLQKLGDPGPGALSLSIKVVTFCLQRALGICLPLQPAFQVSVALY